MKVGYIRVSTQEQNLDRQYALMKEMGVDKVYAEKASGNQPLVQNSRPCFPTSERGTPLSSNPYPGSLVQRETYSTSWIF